MQNRYVGDVGDYAKYALLRSLAPASPEGPRLGINWYMFPDEDHNGDGRHVAYLESAPFAALDRPLHAVLKGIVARGERSVLAVRRSGVLPADALHFAEALPARPRGRSASDALEDRRAWASDARDALAAAGLVFLDPDNGLEVPSVAPWSPKAGKYVLWDEVVGHWDQGQSLLVYHHLNRTKPVGDQVDDLERRFRERLGAVPYLSVPVFRRGSCRAFCVLGQRRHADGLRERERALLGGGWAEHWLAPGTRPG